MVEKWKETLRERSQAMIDGVMGVVIALAAYVVMSVPVTTWIQWWVLLSFFMMVFMVSIFVWDAAANATAITPSDGRLFVLSLILVVFLIPLSFSANLTLSSEIKGLGATFLVISTGLVFALASLIIILALRTPESRTLPRWALADLRGSVIGLVVGSLVAFLSLLIPLRETVSLEPWVNIPVRAMGLAWAFVAFFIVLLVVDFLLRRRMPISIDKSPEVQEMNQVFYSKMRAMNSAIFGMAVSLSAFSLMELPVKTAADLTLSLVHFAFLFFLIVVLWNRLYRIYAVVSTFYEGLDFAVGWVAFFVVLTPPVFRLAILPEAATRQIGSIVFPVLITTLSLNNGALHLYTAGLQRREVAISSKVRKEFRQWAWGSFALGILFLTSLLIPLTATLGYVSLRVIAWWVSLISFVVIMRVVSRVTHFTF